MDVRRALGTWGPRLETIGTSEVRFDSSDFDVDVYKFDQIGRSADPVTSDLDLAIDLHRAPLLESHQGQFVTQQREVRLQKLCDILLVRAERSEQEEGPGRGVPFLRQAVRLNPLDERAARQLMENLAAAGDIAEALETFRKLRQTLSVEYQLEPSDETVATYRVIRTQIQALHRKASTSPPNRVMIPRQCSPLIGREVELATLEALIQSRSVVTVTGLGGVGKTRLAIEVAHALADNEDEVVFLNIANVVGDFELRETLRVKLGIPQSWGLAEWLAERSMTIVLDECERVISEVGEILPELIDAAPNVHFLVTCRIPIGLSSETVFPLGPLLLPPDDATTLTRLESPAVTLLVDRVRKVAPQVTASDANASTLVQIARRLEGLPLSMELAAAQLRVLSLSQLSDRLDRPFELLRSGERDRPLRHRSLLRVVDDSYLLLPPESRQDLRLLAFYVDGFSLEAAESMLGADALSRLAVLVDSSLVYRVMDDDGENRYAILDTIREYALGYATAEDRHTAIRRRYQFVIDLCELANEKIVTAEQAEWIRRLEREMNTIRATLESTQENAAYARIVASLIMFWHVTYRTEEPLSLLRSAVERQECVPTDVLSRIESGYGTIAWQQGDLPEAQRRFRRAVELAESSGASYPHASALNGYSIVSRRLGHYEDAYYASEKCVGLMRKLGSYPRVVRGLAVWARAATALGRFDHAESLFAESIHGFVSIGDERERAHSLEGLAVNLMEQGRLVEAKAKHREAIEALAKLNDAFRLAWSFASVANLLQLEEQFEDAARLLGIVRSIERVHRFEVVSVTSPRDRARIAELRLRLGAQTMEDLAEEVEALDLSQSVEFALRVLQEERG